MSDKRCKSVVESRVGDCRRNGMERPKSVMIRNQPWYIWPNSWVLVGLR